MSCPRPIPLIALLAAALLTACSVDLRPERLEAEGVTVATATEGRATLARMMAAHGGLDRWRSHANISVEISDTWHNALRRALAMPWPQNGQRMRLDVRIADHAARITFLDGPEKGTVWGLTGDGAWIRHRDGAVEDDDGKRFWVRAFAYFVEMPFRLPEAEIVSYEGTEEAGGRTYHRVFATWRAPEPQDDIDHWVAYVDAETGLLGWVAYTIRELAIVPKGAMRFTAHHPMHGLLLPGALDSFRSPQSDTQNHSVRIFDVRFDVEWPANYFERGGAGADEPPAEPRAAGEGEGAAG